MDVAAPFPETQPAGYEWFDDEPAFDSKRHLELEFTSDRDAVIAALEPAVGDVRRAVDEMRAGERMTEHYGG